MIVQPNYTQVPNGLFDSLMRTMNESELRVFLAIVRKTFGWSKERDRISLTQISEMTGLSRSAVVNGLYGRKVVEGEIPVDGLVTRGFVLVFDTPKGNEYMVNVVDQQETELVNVVDQTGKRSGPPLVNVVDQQKKLSKEPLQKKENSDQTDLFTEPSMSEAKPSKLEPDAVLALLNELTGSRFREHKGTGLTKLIAAGYTLDDFRAVFTEKSRQWKGTDFEKYLRPATLFIPAKFEGYLGEAKNQRGGHQGKFRASTFDESQAAYRVETM